MKDAWCEVTCHVCGANGPRGNKRFYTWKQLLKHIKQSHVREYGVEEDSEYQMLYRGIVRRFFGEDVRRLTRGQQPVPMITCKQGKRDRKGRAVPMNEEELK